MATVRSPTATSNQARGRANLRYVVSRTPMLLVPASISARSTSARSRRAQHGQDVRRAGPSCTGSAPARRRRRRPAAAAAGRPATAGGRGRRRWPPAAAPCWSASAGRPASLAEHHPGHVGPPGGSRVPAPTPTAATRIAGRSSQRSASVATSAMPVGVVSSPWPPALHPPAAGQLGHGRHRHRQHAVAPYGPARPRGRPPALRCVDPQVVAGRRRRRPRRRSSPVHRPRGSAPRPAAMPCTRRLGRRPAGRTPRARARVPARPGRRAIRSRTVTQVRCGWSAVATSTSALVARSPARVTVAAVITTARRTTASTAACTAAASAPASSSAPSSMSPATPADASTQACVTRPRPPAGRRGDLRGEVAGAVAVVDVDHRHPRCAGVEHGQQRGEAAERGAVADRGGQRDHRHADQAGHHAGQRAVHAGRDHHRPRPGAAGRAGPAPGAGRRPRRRPPARRPGRGTGR